MLFGHGFPRFRESNSHGDDCAQHAGPLCDTKTVRTQRRPPPSRQQQACSRLAERFPNVDIALFGNAAFIVD